MRNIVTVSLDDKNLEDVDRLRNELGISRSAFLKLCISSYIKSSKALDDFNEMINVMREKKLSTYIDSEAKK